MKHVELVRAEFPALAPRAGRPATIFFDNAAGTQVPLRSIDRIVEYLCEYNANSGGVFSTSIRTDAMLAESRAAMAEFLGAEDPGEVAFGANMTTLTQFFARAFGRDLVAGDEIVTTRLEHEANVSPWVALEERGVRVRFADIHPDDATIDLDSLAEQLNDRTRLVAVGLASNGFGTVNPVRRIAEMAHAAGALCFVDAVHFGPHGVIDVEDLGCDVLVCSAYKFFGPHVGIIWGRRELLDRVRAYHLRTVPARIPDKFEVGTLNHEGIAGVHGALDYLDWLAGEGGSRRERYVRAMTEISAYERTLSAQLLDVFAGHEHVRVFGITDLERLAERVPTFSVTVAGMTPRQAAERLASEGINVWHGNYYALEPMTRIGLEANGGAVRISLVHYNTMDEIARLDEALGGMVA